MSKSKPPKESPATNKTGSFDPRDYPTKQSYLRALHAKLGDLNWGSESEEKFGAFWDQHNPGGGGTVSTADENYDEGDTSGSSEEDALDKLLEEARAVRTENKQTWDDFSKWAIPGLSWDYAAANQSDANSLDELEKLYAGIDPVSAPKYVGDYDSQAATARADKGAIRAQKDALAQYGALTDPTMTAKERFMLEQNRMRQEQDERSSREAALSQLRARGMSGGGAEVGAILGAQEQNSQNRMLGDLGAGGMAVDRALAALRGYADTAGNIRNASFDESYSRGTAHDQAQQFNNNLNQMYRNFKSEFNRQQNNDTAGRGRDIFEAQTGVNNTKANRSRDVVGVGLSTTAGKTGQYSGDSAPIIGGHKFVSDRNVHRNDMNLLYPKDEEFNPLDPSTWDELFS